MSDLFENITRRASISSCGTYRYRLTRHWGGGPFLPFIMLNPSTADHEIDDPTIRRCMGFARREGAGGIIVGNLYAFRATRPEDMKRANDPFGPGNEEALTDIALEAAGCDMPVVCAWGASGGIFGGDRAAIDQLKKVGARLVCLGKCANGMPKHPLYIAGAQPLEAFP